VRSQKKFMDKQSETCQKNSGSEETIGLITKNQKIITYYVGHFSQVMSFLCKILFDFRL
jgi:hypothetical protein